MPAKPIFTSASSNLESGNAIAVDTLNQWIYVVGRFTNNSTFPSIPSFKMNAGFNNSKKDGFLAKLNFSGTLLWVVNMGSVNDDETVNVAVGPDNNVYITGYYEGTCVFNSVTGPGFNLAPANSQEDIFLASYNSTGMLRWAKNSGGPHFDKGMGVTVSNTGVYACGIYEKDAIVGGVVVNPTYNDVNTYLWKTDFLGNTLWMIEAKSNSDDYDEGLSVQELKMDVCTYKDTAYVIGYMGGSSVRFTNPSGSLLSTPILNNADSKPDIFVYSSTSDGAVAWAVSFSNNSPNIQGYGIAADCYGVYITGSIHDNAVFPSTAPSATISLGEHDYPFLACLSHDNGVDMWIKGMKGGMDHQDVTYDVVADGYGYVYVTGRFRSNPFQMPDTTITGAVDAEVFISKYRNDGDFIWTKNTASAGNDMGYGLATYRNTKVFVTGEYSFNLNFGSVTTTSGSGQNLFVSSFNAGSTVYYSCCTVPSVGGTANVSPADFCPGSAVTLYLTGYSGAIQWQVSYNSGATWSGIPGGTSDTMSYSPTANHPWFRAVVKNENCAPVLSNTVTTTQYETVPPTIIGCPSNINVNTQAGLCSAVVVWTSPSVSDNCSGATITQTAGPASGSAFPKGITTITYTATDVVGNTSACSFTVTVTDNENPSISGCPSNVVVSNDPGVCTANVSWTAPMASDNCPGATIAQTAGPASGSAFPKGTTTVTYTATDAAGHITTCSFTVTVNDNEDPVISGCPSNVIVSNDPGVCTANVSWTAPTASDNCAGVTLAQTAGLPSGSAFPKGVTTVMYTATDAAGNSVTCSFTVTVNDNENPVISGCPSNMIVSSDPGVCTANVSWTAPTAGDNCPGVTIAQTAGLASGSAFPKGTTTVTYTATDAAGHTATCSFTITVNDNQDPVITGCPADIVVPNDPGVCTANVSWGAPGVSDNCTGATIVQTAGPTSGSAFPKGVTMVTYTATDASGNTSTCSFIVTVNDTENPVISGCPADMVVPNDPGVCTANVSWVAPSVSDNCTGASIAQTAGPPSGSAFPEGNTTVTYTATDASGNTSTCSFTVTVNDTEVPQITGCPGNITSCDSLIFYSLPEGIDNCSGVSVAQTDMSGLTSGSIFPIGITPQSFTLMDSSGNFSTCTFNVTILPVIDPQLLNVPDSFCYNAPPFNLDLAVLLHPGEISSFYGSPGTVIGAEHLFYPALSTTGIHQIYHVVTNGVCSDTAMVEVNVLKHYQSLWTASDTLCAASGVLVLDSLLLPTADHGGNWLINGLPVIVDPDLHLWSDSILEFTYFVGDAGCNDTTVHSCWVAPEASAAWDFGPDTACSTFTVDLNTLVTGTPGGIWTGNGVIGNNFDPAALAGLQHIQYTSGVPSCRTSHTDSIFIYAYPVIDAGPEEEVCGHDYQMQATVSLGTVAWSNRYGNVSFEDTTLSKPLVSVANQGNYVFQLYVTNGVCKAIDSVGLVFWEQPSALAGTDQYLEYTTSTEIMAYAPEYGTGEWEAGLPNISFANPYDTATTVYYLLPGNNILYWTVTNGSCPQVRDEVIVHVNELFIPTGFSPNGDGINDFFEIRNIGNFENKLQVFNRWGQVVFEAANYANGWNGNDKANEPLPDDTYFYTLDVTGLPVFSGYVIIKKQ